MWFGTKFVKKFPFDLAKILFRKLSRTVKKRFFFFLIFMKFNITILFLSFGFFFVIFEYWKFEGGI